jgi:hypothetical protein
MPEVTAPTPEEANQALQAETERLCAIAFAHDCRLAVRVTGAFQLGGRCTFLYEFVVLLPGETPPESGWTIYENRSGIAAGRSV